LQLVHEPATRLHRAYGQLIEGARQHGAWHGSRNAARV
jgi:hypothetical protein